MKPNDDSLNELEAFLANTPMPEPSAHLDRRVERLLRARLPSSSTALEWDEGSRQPLRRRDKFWGSGTTRHHVLRIATTVGLAAAFGAGYAVRDWQENAMESLPRIVQSDSDSTRESTSKVVVPESHALPQEAKRHLIHVELQPEARKRFQEWTISDEIGSSETFFGPLGSISVVRTLDGQEL